jgi:hypothetical protein
MIGSYIIVRMIELLVLHPRTITFGVVRAFAIVTILICLVSMADLFSGAARAADSLATSPFGTR